MARCHCRHHHLCGVCAAKQAASLPVKATVGLLWIGLSPAWGAWKLGRALHRRKAQAPAPEAPRGRHAAPSPAKWSNRR